MPKPRESKPKLHETVDTVKVGDLVRVQYADHALFLNQDPRLFRQAPVLDTTGTVIHLDNEVVVLVWEKFDIPTAEGPKARASGVTIHRTTIISLRRLPS